MNYISMLRNCQRREGEDETIFLPEYEDPEKPSLTFDILFHSSCKSWQELKIDSSHTCFRSKSYLSGLHLFCTRKSAAEQ